MTFLPKIHGPCVDDDVRRAGVVGRLVDLADRAVERFDLVPDEVRLVDSEHCLVVRPQIVLVRVVLAIHSSFEDVGVLVLYPEDEP